MASRNSWPVVRFRERHEVPSMTYHGTPGLHALQVSGERVEIVVVDVAVEAVVDHLEHATGPDASAPLGRQRHPRAPEARPLGFVLRELPEHRRVEVPAVHPLMEDVDGVVRTLAVVTGHDDHCCEPGTAQVVLRVEEIDAELRKGGLVRGLGDPLAPHGFVEQETLPGRRPDANAIHRTVPGRSSASTCRCPSRGTPAWASQPPKPGVALRPAISCWISAAVRFAS